MAGVRTQTRVSLPVCCFDGIMYKVEIPVECGARSYRPRVLLAQQGRAIPTWSLAQQEPADSPVPAGDSMPLSMVADASSCNLCIILLKDTACLWPQTFLVSKVPQHRSLSAWLKATIQFPLLYPFSIHDVSSPTVNISKKSRLSSSNKAWVAHYTGWAWSLQV